MLTLTVLHYNLSCSTANETVHVAFDSSVCNICRRQVGLEYEICDPRFYDFVLFYGLFHASDSVHLLYAPPADWESCVTYETRFLVDEVRVWVLELPLFLTHSQKLLCYILWICWQLADICTQNHKTVFTGYSIFTKESGNYDTELFNYNMNVCVYIRFELEKMDYNSDCESICHYCNKFNFTLNAVYVYWKLFICVCWPTGTVIANW